MLSSKLHDEKKVQLLKAKDSRGTPGLQLTFQHGHTEVVKAYTNAVLSSTLDDEKKVQLLEAKNSNGTIGFSAALSSGYTEAVKAYTNAVLSSKLDDEKKVRLLGSNGISRISVLHCALLILGRTEAVEAYTNAVLSSTLDNEKKVRLLEFKGRGTSGLSLGFDNGCTEAVKAYTNAVLSSGLTNNEILGLLERDSDSVLKVVCNTGHTETVNEYVKCILRSSKLSAAEKEQIFKSYGIEDGLWKSLKEEDSRTDEGNTASKSDDKSIKLAHNGCDVTGYIKEGASRALSTRRLSC